MYREFFSDLMDLENEALKEAQELEEGRKVNNAARYALSRVVKRLFRAVQVMVEDMEEDDDINPIIEYIRRTVGMDGGTDLLSYLSDSTYNCSKTIADYIVENANNPEALKAFHLRQKGNSDPNQFTREHGMPVNVYLKAAVELVKEGNWTLDTCTELTDKLFQGRTIVTIGEDKMLNDAKLRIKMPAGWDWKTGSPRARYDAVGIEVVTKDDIVRMYENAKRNPVQQEPEDEETAQEV